MDTNKLKHCPFCNEIACIGIDVDGSVSGTVGAAQFSFIYCGVTTPFFVDVYDAVETWNARVERTCSAYYLEGDVTPRCDKCHAPLLFEPSYHLPNYCNYCGAKVVE